MKVIQYDSISYGVVQTATDIKLNQTQFLTILFHILRTAILSSGYMRYLQIGVSLFCSL
jgi:hypothetical protein